MSKKTKYEDKYIKSNRTFPVGNTVLLVIAVVIQIACVFFGITHQPVPQDRIRQYNVTAEPLADGSLDIEYELVWEALDPAEELTWVEIGMANDNFTVYPDSVSSSVESYSKYEEDGYVTLQLDFRRAYTGGETVAFSFRVNQKEMLCKDAQGYFYEFVPGWFNRIQVDQYRFAWRTAGKEDCVWQGSLDYGEYEIMSARYGLTDFDGCQVVKYHSFDDSGAYNGLEEDKTATMVLCFVVAGLIIAAEVYIIDSYVSYNRGRGFLTGHGYHIHTYGRTNPYYIRARDKYNAAHRSGGGRSGGCACACACACAGGGRAGCSQKDTFGNQEE